jgi:hypothetical protein
MIARRGLGIWLPKPRFTAPAWQGYRPPAIPATATPERRA